MSPAKVTFTLLLSPFQAELLALQFPGKQSQFWGLLRDPTEDPQPLPSAPRAQGEPAPFPNPHPLGLGQGIPALLMLFKMQAPSVPAPAPPLRRCLPVFPLAPLGHIFISNLPKPPSFPRVDEKPLLEVRMNL